MSPLHHARLLAEGAAPADQAATSSTPSPSTNTSSSGNREGKVEPPVPPQRQGKTQPARTITVKAAGAKAVAASAATAKAASAKAATTTVTATRKAAAAKRAAGTKAQATTRTVAKPATATTKAVATPASAGPGAGAEVTAATPRPARAARPVGAARRGRAHSGARHRVETPARIAAARAVVAQLIAANVASAAPAVEPVATRPTPYRRTAPGVPSTDPAGVVPAVAGDRSRALRSTSSARRRRSLYLAVALVGALSIGGASAGVPAEARTTTVSPTLSVAEQLGLEGPALARSIPDADVTTRLGELVVSRSARDAERTAAADAQAEADRLAVAAAEEAARPDVVLPVEGARLTSGFGARWGTLHAGIDLAAPMRTPEYAVMDGVVLEAGPASGFGLAVYIQHENGDVTVYGHMDEILVEPGQVVRAGETIALLGNRGQSTGPHLHFEVHVGGLDGQKIDPVPWLRERGAQI